MNGSRKFDTAQGTIEYDKQWLEYKATIQLTAYAPHVGADSPRFLEPGKRHEVAYFELYNGRHPGNGRREVTALFMDCELEEIRERILHDWKIRRLAKALMAEGEPVDLFAHPESVYRVGA